MRDDGINDAFKDSANRSKKITLITSKLLKIPSDDVFFNL